MCKFGCILLFVIAFAAQTFCAKEKEFVANGQTIESPLLPKDLSRLNKVFEENIKSNDLQSIYYSAINLFDLSTEAKLAACKRLLEAYGESKLNDFEKNYYLSGGHATLKCAVALPATVTTAIKSAFSKDIVTSQELYYSLQSYKAVNAPLDVPLKAKLAKNLQEILKKDDSLNSVGYAFFIAADLGEVATFVHDRIEDAIVQADEVDGKMLQFEGGLSITGLVLTGALKLTKALTKPVPITATQCGKFAAYFLSRRSVQSAKGASVLFESLRTIVSYSEIAPISIQIERNGKIYPERPFLDIHLFDLLGNPAKVQMTYAYAWVLPKSGAPSTAEKSALMASVTDKSHHYLDLDQFKPSSGYYSVEILAGTYKRKFDVIIMNKATVNDFEIGVGDVDGGSNIKTQKLAYPNRLPAPLNADSQQKLVIRTTIVDSSSGVPLTAHQAFIRLSSVDSREEIIFVAEQEISRLYKFDMDVGARSADFGYKSGLYKIEMIMGDVSFSNSFIWNLGDINLKFAQDGLAKKSDNSRSVRPEIAHKFREPESRPPRFFSDLFSFLCAAPLLILLGIWAKMQINISNFPCSLAAVGFHLGLGSILGLFVIFWMKLDMFETVKLLLPLALFTFLTGNKLLRSIAARKQEKPEK